MLAELVFVTRLLGLMNGARPIEIAVDPSVHSIDVLLDDQRIATLNRPPWRAIVDFGKTLAPHELTAIARNAEGTELARDTQFVNLARPHAELGVQFRQDEGRVSAIVRWQHIADSIPIRIQASLDGQSLPASVGAPIPLPELEPGVHVLGVELGFADSAVARKELVFGLARYSEELPAELTATLMWQRPEGRTDAANCFRLNGQTVPASAVETGEAIVVFVRTSRFNSVKFWQREEGKPRMPERLFTIPDAALRFVWTAVQPINDASLFGSSNAVNGESGVRLFLSRQGASKQETNRFADAVAVAGVETLEQPRRRAVVLVVDTDDEASVYSAATVQRYLERIGVPLYIWSTKPGIAALKARWNEVEFVGSPGRLRAAIDNLRRDLNRQRIAWLPLSPMDALRVEVVEDCAWEPIAR